MTDFGVASLLTVIVDAGKARKIMQTFYKHLQTGGGTYVYGNGTVEQKLLKLLNLDSTKKELLLLILPSEQVEAYLHLLLTQFHFSQPGKGIAFAIKLISTKGLGAQFAALTNNTASIAADFSMDLKTDNIDSAAPVAEENLSAEAGANGSLKEAATMAYSPTAVSSAFEQQPKSKNFTTKGESAMPKEQAYQSIFVIVNRGMGDTVVEKAQGAGARGATIMHGRGTGEHVRHKVFDFVLEPEKELVLLLVQETQAAAIIAALDKEINFAQAGAGILFSLPVDQVIGLA